MVPNQFKNAKVVPIWKAGDRRKVDHYRPVSLLSVLSKVLEGSAKQQLYGFLEESGFFAEKVWISSWKVDVASN